MDVLHIHPTTQERRIIANYRIIALVSHASKIGSDLRIIRVKTETEIADEQTGFRQDQITNEGY